LFARTVLRRAAIAALACCAGAHFARAAALDPPDTEQPLWRATHGVLLAVTQAGARLVAVGDRGTILLSDDQGATWTQAPSGTTELLTSILFVSPTEGYAAGQDSIILHTTDAGAHWTQQMKAEASDQALFSLASLGGTHLIASGAYALMLETTDGAHWTPVKLPNLDEDYHLNCVMAHDQEVVTTGESGHVFMRLAAGWKPIPVPYQGSLFGCLAQPDGTFYTFGLRGSLFASTPQVTAWTRIETGEQRSIFGGAALTSGLVAFVGSNGLMMVFDPKTNKLRHLPQVTGATLSGVTEIAGGKWAVVGQDGVHIVDPSAPVEVTQ